MGIDHPKGIIKNIVPIVMAGVLGIYGLIVSVIITQAISAPGGDMTNTYSVYNGYTHVSSMDVGYSWKQVRVSNCFRLDSWPRDCAADCLVWQRVVLLD